MVKNTACENCPFKAQGFSECPNYIETVWTDESNPSQPQIVRDCAPRRTLLLLQDLYNRCFGMQKQINQAEGEIGKLTSAFKQILESVNTKALEGKRSGGKKMKQMDFVTGIDHDV